MAHEIRKTGMKHGAYSALSSFAFFLIIYFTHHNPISGPLTWIGSSVFILFIAMGTKEYRDLDNKGFLTYGQGVAIGMMITFAAAVLYAMLVYVFGTVIDIHILDIYKTEALEGLEKGKAWISEDLFQKAGEQIEKISMRDIAFSDFYKTLFGGLLVSLIVAAILRKEQPPMRSNEQIITN